MDKVIHGRKLTEKIHSSKDKCFYVTGGLGHDKDLPKHPLGGRKSENVRLKDNYFYSYLSLSQSLDLWIKLSPLMSLNKKKHYKALTTHLI